MASRFARLTLSEIGLPNVHVELLNAPGLLPFLARRISRPVIDPIRPIGVAWRGGQPATAGRHRFALTSGAPASGAGHLSFAGDR
jgi:hypothetical protein